MTTQEIVEQHLAYWTKGKAPPSPAAKRVAALLHEWNGLHHFDNGQMSKVDWSNSRYVEIPAERAILQFSTYDFDALTTLVFLAHDHGIRVDISPRDRSKLTLLFHPRDGRAGKMSERHPTIEFALAQWRQTHPTPVPGAPQ